MWPGQLGPVTFLRSQSGQPQVNEIGASISLTASTTAIAQASIQENDE